MKVTSALLALAFSTLLQRAPSPQELLRLQRSLRAAEMDTVVSGILQSLTGMTLRLRESRGADREILMGPAGMPRMTRSSHMCTRMVDGECAVLVTGDPAGVARVPTRFVVLTEFSGESARRCNGTPATGEMVRQYVLNSTTQTWTVTAHEARPWEISIARPLEMLKSVQLTTGANRLIGNRTARALIAALPPSDAGNVLLTGDPAPNQVEFVPAESLWIDVDSLLPLRWEVSQRQAIVAAIDFVYEQLDLRRPAGFEVPHCIP